MYKLDKDPDWLWTTPQGNATSRNLPCLAVTVTDPRLPAPQNRTLPGAQADLLRWGNCTSEVRKVFGCLCVVQHNYPTLFCSSLQCLQACPRYPTFILWVYGCWMFILYHFISLDVFAVAVAASSCRRIEATWMRSRLLQKQWRTRPRLRRRRQELGIQPNQPAFLQLVAVLQR